MKFVFFPVSENGENGLGDEGADGGNTPSPQNFWARTAACISFKMSILSTIACFDSCTPRRSLVNGRVDNVSFNAVQQTLSQNITTTLSDVTSAQKNK